jgi:hypothetical protein
VIIWVVENTVKTQLNYDKKNNDNIGGEWGEEVSLYQEPLFSKILISKWHYKSLIGPNYSSK